MTHRLLLAGATCALAVPLAAQEPRPPESPGPILEMPGIRKLTVGFQYRLRYENQIRYDFDDAGDADNDFFTQRVRVNLGFELTEDLSAFVQIQDAREWGEETSTIDDNAEGLDLHQGYLDVRDMPGIDGTLRLGRQELHYGDQRLIGTLDWKAQARSFDGLRQRWSLGDNQNLDVVVTQTEENLNAVSDDVYFGGGYATLAPVEALILDLYLLLLHDDGDPAAGGTENRFTAGTRVIWDPQPLQFGAELTTQFGDEMGQDIPIADTYALHAHAQWTFDGRTKPYLKVGLDMASGDDPNTADRERFDNLFPTAHAHWGMMDLAQWENLVNPHVQAGCLPAEHVGCSLAWHRFRSMEETDRFGGPNAILSPGGAGFSREMGDEIDLVVTRDLELGKGLKGHVQFGYGIFLPGQGVEDAQGTDDIAHFVYLQTMVAF